MPFHWCDSLFGQDVPFLAQNRLNIEFLFGWLDLDSNRLFCDHLTYRGVFYITSWCRCSGTNTRSQRVRLQANTKHFYFPLHADRFDCSARLWAAARSQNEAAARTGRDAQRREIARGRGKKSCTERSSTQKRRKMLKIIQSHLRSVTLPKITYMHLASLSLASPLASLLPSFRRCKFAAAHLAKRFSMRAGVRLSSTANGKRQRKQMKYE